MDELRSKLGWKSPIEVGKFYDHSWSSNWYYFVYGDSKTSKAGGKPMNEISKLVCHSPVYGDLVVVRSGPMGSDYPEQFKRGDLAKAVEFYTDGKNDKDEVFNEREFARFSRRMEGGMPSGSTYHGSY
ncbi:hypothetical protein MMC25_001343 [Agyrium rufum]|nr:hypothetical protein [Agyrium rufum]